MLVTIRHFSAFYALTSKFSLNTIPYVLENILYRWMCFMVSTLTKHSTVKVENCNSFTLYFWKWIQWPDYKSSFSIQRSIPKSKGGNVCWKSLQKLKYIDILTSQFSLYNTSIYVMNILIFFYTVNIKKIQQNFKELFHERQLHQGLEIQWKLSSEKFINLVTTFLS